MSVFKVQINGEGEDAVYEILEDSHNDTAIHAAEKALRTYRDHGHGRFPYNDGRLSVVVEEIEYVAPSSTKEASE